MSNIFDTRHLVSALCLALLTGLSTAQAAVNAANVTVQVRIMAGVCVVNQNNVIEVNFGNDVLTTQVDGVSYKKMPLVYSVNCNGSFSNQVKMFIEGNGAGFNPTMLATNQADLAIALLKDGKPYPINSWSNFNDTALPRLEAVPAKRPGITLKGGRFSAGATMKVEYQ